MGETSTELIVNYQTINKFCHLFRERMIGMYWIESCFVVEI